MSSPATSVEIASSWRKLGCRVLMSTSLNATDRGVARSCPDSETKNPDSETKTPDSGTKKKL